MNKEQTENKSKWQNITEADVLSMDYAQLDECWDFLPTEAKSNVTLAYAISQWAQKVITEALAEVNGVDTDVTLKGNINFRVFRGEVKPIDLALLVTALELLTPGMLAQAITSTLSNLGKNPGKRNHQRYCPFVK